MINEVGIIYCGKCKFYDKCNSAQMPCLRMEKIKDWHKQEIISMLNALKKELYNAIDGIIKQKIGERR